jgi:hypothetical protein
MLANLVWTIFGLQIKAFPGGCFRGKNFGLILMRPPDERFPEIILSPLSSIQ